jgi:hypothetical protein
VASRFAIWLSAGHDISVSSIWTPSGEHRPEPESDAPEEGGPEGEPSEAEVAAELRRVRAELAATPVVDLIANHAVGLWQLGVLHLVPDGDAPPRLDEAALAIDALAGLVESLGDRLGRHAEPLRDALSQLRMAYVQIQERSGASSAEGNGT